MKPADAEAGARATRAKKIARLLVAEYPDARCMLDHESPFQLLVATILAAQCTDERVNRVTPALFKRFGTPKEMARAEIAELETLVKSTGFFRNKAKSIKAASVTLAEGFPDRFPATMEELLTLPGVGRKTANVILGTCSMSLPSSWTRTCAAWRSVSAWRPATTPRRSRGSCRRCFPARSGPLFPTPSPSMDGAAVPRENLTTRGASYAPCATPGISEEARNATGAGAPTAVLVSSLPERYSVLQEEREMKMNLVALVVSLLLLATLSLAAQGTVALAGRRRPQRSTEPSAQVSIPKVLITGNMKLSLSWVGDTLAIAVSGQTTAGLPSALAPRR